MSPPGSRDAAAPLVRLHDVSVTYHGGDAPALVGADLTLVEGELVVVVGRTGSGKSTLLRTLDGLVPHASGGTLSGQVLVDGRDTATHPPRELADVVGFVPQDPAAAFVADVVEDEVAAAAENLAVPPVALRRRVEDALDLLGLADLRARAVGTLSGGQAQRVAVAAVLTASPRLLVLDEPTSALDPVAAEEVLSSLARLVHDVGLTVVVAEHRLERVVHHADRVVVLNGDGRPPEAGLPADLLARSPVAPPLVALGRRAGWSPLPLSVRDARRRAGPLREALADVEPPAPRAVTSGPPVLEATRVRRALGGRPVLDDVSLAVRPGEVVALMGRNGSGKSTLLGLLAGLRAPDGGWVRVDGQDPVALRPARRVRQVALVPQDPGVLLYAETVAAECAGADREGGLPAGTTAAAVEAVVPGLPGGRHPRDLSEGQRLGLALGVVLAPAPRVVLLDEPTRGLDYPGKERLVGVLRDLADRGHAVLVATHDVELAAELADRTVVLGDGDVVADGPTRDVVRQSPGFAPQVAKVMAPQEWLSVAEVAAALEPSAATGARA